MQRMRIKGPALGLAAMAFTLTACGGGDGDNGGGPNPNAPVIAKAAPSGDNQVGPVTQPLANALRVIVTRDGAPASGINVSWSTSGTGASMNPTTVATDASGIAQSGWTLGQVAGLQTAQASVSGATGSPLTFNATATAAAASQVVLAGGNAQSGVVTTVLQEPLRVRVTDPFGNRVAGVSTAWSVTSGSASVAPTGSNTDVNGEAATTVTLGGTAGPITIQAVIPGLTGSPVNFTATATNAPTGSNISVSNNVFSPAVLTISAGTTVTWTWQPTGGITHNVVPDATDPTRSGNPVASPSSYQFTFNTPGTFDYYCEVHGGPGRVGMSGRIIVQ